MKRLFSTLMILYSCILASSQNDASKRDEFRRLAISGFHDMETELNAVYIIADSLNTKSANQNLKMLDSLSADSANGHFYLPFVELEKHFYFSEIQKAELSMGSLRKFQTAIGELPIENEFAIRSHTYAAEEFDHAGDNASAIISMKKLLLASEAKLSSSEISGVMLSDSLNSKVMSLEGAMQAQKEKLESENMLYMEGLAASGVVILILLIVLFMTRWKLQKRVQSLLKKQPDTSEAELLAQKVVDLQNETTQFKKTAQSMVNKLNSMDTTNRKATEELALLSADVESSLNELKQQCITNKASISPPVFMTIQNVATRLGNSSTERIKSIAKLLS